MLSILIVEKNQNIKQIKIKNYNEEELYKKAGFKSKNDFTLHNEWHLSINNIIYDVCLYGKTKGRKNNQNTYVFPEPVNNLIFYGNCILLNKNNKLFSLNDWLIIVKYINENDYKYINNLIINTNEEIKESDEIEKENILKEETETYEKEEIEENQEEKQNDDIECINELDYEDYIE